MKKVIIYLGLGFFIFIFEKLHLALSPLKEILGQFFEMFVLLASLLMWIVIVKAVQ